ncbi:MAG: hypothetical protein K1000chlam2_00022 [Chlamydiae bacterium]|nr:hypothetical protein [Chlamydiota bacterium]
MKPLIDMTNQTYGSWKVLKRGPNTKQGQAQWICECQGCFELKIVKGSHLRDGRSTKCKDCHNKSFNRRHGMYRSNVYGIWEEMIQRCSNSNNQNFKKYGGRGIKVCESWKDDFLNFWGDMGNKPEGMSLDRIDNDGNYSKSNCRWADRLTQSQNTRRSHLPGNIYGDWRLLENTPYSKKSTFECVRCGRKRTDETFYVTSKKAACCKCT